MPILFDNKVIMAKATAQGMRFPRTVLGEAHQWLRTTFPAPAPPSPPSSLPQTNGGAEEEQATQQAVAGTEVVRNADSGEGTNSGSVTNGERKVGGLEAGAERGEETADGGASAAAAAAAMERTRKAWDAVFAPGFEERYKGRRAGARGLLFFAAGGGPGFVTGKHA